MMRLINTLQPLVLITTAVCTCLFAACADQSSDRASQELVLLTTTSVQDSGLLDVLVPEFEKRTVYRVKVIATGSGSALKQGAQGEGDVLLSHSPEAEKEWMQQGYGLSRRLVMYNDFVLIGPRDDPARIKGLPAVKAFRSLAMYQAVFVSRGDQSGTHVRELALWKQAGVQPQGQPWYRETGQGQGLTMEMASQWHGYALTDRGTFLVHQKRLDLEILVENDPCLQNVYHVLTVNPNRFPRVNAQAAEAFADFLLSPAGQQLIGEFGQDRFGRSLFIPAADKTEEELLHE